MANKISTNSHDNAAQNELAPFDCCAGLVDIPSCTAATSCPYFPRAVMIPTVSRVFSYDDPELQALIAECESRFN